MSDIKPQQVYADNDPRMKGRTIVVRRVVGERAMCEVVTNANDIQMLLDDPDSPGTRNYTPQDRRGKGSQVSLESLRSRFTLVKDVE